MNKGDLINRVANEVNLTKAQAASAVNTVFDAVGDAMANGSKASFIGFGTFSISHRKSRMGRNPQTGKEIKIAAKNVVRFKPGKALADRVN